MEISSEKPLHSSNLVEFLVRKCHLKFPVKDISAHVLFQTFKLFAGTAFQHFVSQ